jgi:hypothetical protein
VGPELLRNGLCKWGVSQHPCQLVVSNNPRALVVLIFAGSSCADFCWVIKK